MKNTLAILAMMTALAAAGADSRVVYNKATPEVNQRAINILNARFDATNDFAVAGDLFANMLLCPAGLWEQIMNHSAVTGITQGVMQARVPLVKDGKVVRMVPRAGKLFQSRAEIAMFWDAFRSNVAVTGQATIRKLNEQECDVVWTMIPFPINEPAFVIEWPDHKILVFMTSDCKIAYMDELQRYIDGTFWREKTGHKDKKE